MSENNEKNKTAVDQTDAVMGLLLCVLSCEGALRLIGELADGGMAKGGDAWNALSRVRDLARAAQQHLTKAAKTIADQE